MMTAVSTSLVGDLILVRLLASAKRAPSLADLRKDLERFFKQPPNGEQWQGYLEELVQAGLLTVKPYRLTDSGRAQALGFLGMESLPSRLNWKIIRDRYLVPKALGVPANDPDTRKRITDGEGLGAYLVETHYALPAGSGKTLPQALAALVCKELVLPLEKKLAAVPAAVLSRILGSMDRLSMKDIQKQLPRKVVGARKGGADGLREAVLQRWVDGASDDQPEVTSATAESSESGAFDLAAFAATVRAAARDCPTGRFGDNKVFINHVWRHLRNERSFPALDLTAFKDHLAEANHAGLLRLERADLVQAMDPGDVRESETSYLNAIFHFVLLERDRP